MTNIPDGILDNDYSLLTTIFYNKYRCILNKKTHIIAKKNIHFVLHYVGFQMSKQVS